MSFEQSSDPTVMATPPVPPYEPPGFSPNFESQPPKKKKTWLIVLIIILLVLCCCCLLIGGAGYWLYTNGMMDTNFNFDLGEFSRFTPYLTNLA
jgi:hypothetical protein